MSNILFILLIKVKPVLCIGLAGRDLALFVDASVRAPAPFLFSALAPARDRTFTSHAMSPAALLAACAEALGAPPPSFVLAIRGERFELGDAMSASARANLRQAPSFYERLLADLAVGAWNRMAGASATRSPGVGQGFCARM